MGWVNEVPNLAGLDTETTARLNALTPLDVPKGTVLFSPGESVKGYVVVMSGKVNVSLSGSTGREMLLYDVAPGQSCIQSTLGLLGGDDYTAEAVAESDSRLVLLPRSMFMELLDVSKTFRALVFTAFAGRMQTMMQLLERVAFQRVECRLAAHLLAQSTADGPLIVTQQDLATAVGSAREVISRRLDVWSRRGWVKTGRGTVKIIDTDALQILADEPM